jgi:hypothetical protein
MIQQMTALAQTQHQTQPTALPVLQAPTPPAPAPPSPPPSSVLAPAKVDEYNRLSLNFRTPVPRPKVRGIVIDWHTHLIAARHARAWFEAADHYGIDVFVSMTPLEEALVVQREWPGRVHFIVIPKWGEVNYDDWMRRLVAFYNLGSRVIKFHMAPGTMQARGWNLATPGVRKIMREAASRGMILMSHVGDPDTWYNGKYTDQAKFGTREQHYQLWEDALSEFRDHPWVGAHMGGNPEDLVRLQRLLDTYPNLYLDSSATRWMQREVSARRDAARDFIIRNQDRILFGSDQVSGDDRGFDFLASRFWVHRKLWDTAYTGPSPILDPDLPRDQQPTLRGLALPDGALQKMYHDNAVKLMARVGVKLEVEAVR